MAVDPRRVEISKRLKAARQLAGYVDDDGRVRALSVAELIRLPDLAQNEISRNRVEDIEQLKVDARPMELKAIADALSLPTDWFAKGGGEPLSQPIADLLRAVESDALARRQRAEAAHEESDAEDHPPAAGEGGAG